MNGPTIAAACRRVVHVYGEAGAEVAALRGVDLDVARGESVAVLGPSGAGKSTLLWLLAGLARPTAGEVVVDGVPLADLDGAGLRRLRAERIGVLLQNPGRNLVQYATCRQNVLFAPRPGRDVRRRERAARADELLDAVGLAASADAAAGGLSGGEQQRLALAVALVNRPALLLADEPTSQLDVDSAAAVVELLRGATRTGTTVVVVTHDSEVATEMERTVTLADGRIGQQTRAGRPVVTMGADGSVHLPPEVLEVLPPGTPLTVERLDDGVVLRREAR